MSTQAAVERLWRERPRSVFTRGSVIVLALGGAAALATVGSDLLGTLAPRRLANLERFLTSDALPAPLRDGGSASDLVAWLEELLAGGAAQATLATLAIAIVALGLAAVLGSVLAITGSRELTAGDPFAAQATPRPTGRVAAAVRLLAVLLRSVPEYVLTFLLLGLLGPSAWPAVVALALHNAGILGRLGAETIEDLERRPVRALVRTGAGRAGLVLGAVVPLASRRFLLHAAVRLETCLREATVLGMLGIASLGASVEEARARQRYDELLVLVVLAGLLVAGVDLGSRRARRWLRAAP